MTYAEVRRVVQVFCELRGVTGGGKPKFTSPSGPPSARAVAISLVGASVKGPM